MSIHFELAEVFHFDWGCEYLDVGGLRGSNKMILIKLAASLRKIVITEINFLVINFRSFILLHPTASFHCKPHA